MLGLIHAFSDPNHWRYLAIGLTGFALGMSLMIGVRYLTLGALGVVDDFLPWHVVFMSFYGAAVALFIGLELISRYGHDISWRTWYAICLFGSFDIASVTIFVYLGRKHPKKGGSQ